MNTGLMGEGWPNARNPARMSNRALRFAVARHNRTGQLNSGPLAESQKTDGDRQAATIVVSAAKIQA